MNPTHSFDKICIALIQPQWHRYSASWRAILPCMLILLFLNGVTAAAQQATKVFSVEELACLELEELLTMEVRTVSTASRHEQPIAEAPVAISVVTARDIKRHGYRTLSQILRTLPGFNVSLNGNYEVLGIRGFSRPGDYNSRSLLVDGIPFNESIYGTGPIGREFPIDVSLIERVEVVRGPSFSLYGNNAFFGVVNVITRQPDRSGKSEWQADIGSDFAREARYTWSGEANHGELLLSGSLLEAPGRHMRRFSEFAETNDGVTEDTDFERSHQGFAKFQRGRFLAEAAWGSRRKGLSSAPFNVVFNDGRNLTNDLYSFWNLQYRMPCRDGSTLDLRYNQFRFDYDGHYLYDWADPGNPPNLVMNLDSAHHASRGFEGTWSKKIGRSHQVVAGFEFKDIYRQDQENRDLVLYLESFRSQRSNALYLQDEWRLSPRFSLSAGNRLEWTEGFGTRSSPRFGAVWKLDPKRSLKLLLGRSYKLPNAFERFYQDGGASQVTNPGLMPETNEMLEASYETVLGRSSSACLTGYRYRLKNLFEREPVDPADPTVLIFRNTADVMASGFELGLTRRWQDGTRARLSWSLQNTEYVDAPGKILANSPNHIGQLVIEHPIPRLHLDAGFELLYMGPRQTRVGNKLPGQPRLNLWFMHTQALRNVELSVGMDNVFNAANSDPVGQQFRQETLPLPGRTFRVRAVYQF